MQAARPLTFGAYRLDPQTGQVWRGKQAVKLTPKAAAVLRYVVARAGQVVTKDDLFAAVWPETVVSDAALTSCIQELRQALRDSAKQPRLIETVHRRGFQFIGKVSGPPSAVSEQQEGGGDPSFTLTTEHSPQPIVGRESELAQLHSWFNKALRGERQVVFVTGEPGIGKTSVVEAFLQRPESRVPRLASEHAHRPRIKGQGVVVDLTPNTQHPTPSSWIGRGQCIEHYGTGEPYLPVLEALGRLCREPDGQRLIKILSQHAPSWLVQMPALLSAAELESLQRKGAGATKERMLRELAEAVEALTVERPLVLWLEDLHWSDVSTLDWLAYVARRHERARLLIIGTYRPVEVLTREHPLKGIKQELQLHGQCEELALDFLREEHVAEYLEVRFSGGARRAVPLRQLAQTIYRRTDGNPLFMVNVTNELVSRGIIAPGEEQWVLPERVADIDLAVPDNLRQLIERQVEQVSHAEREILEAASVAGAEFSAAAVAAGVEQSAEAVEAQCEALVRREQFLRAHGTAEWPDGTVAACYGFVHALYQDVLYEQISASRCIRLHGQIGERVEQGYGNQAREIAAGLAVHFERGRDYQRAVEYRHRAGENALRRSADHEAVNHFTKGLELLKTFPTTPERNQQEFSLQLALGAPLISTKGYAALEVERAYSRARELAQQIGETTRLVSTMLCLLPNYAMQAKHKAARELSEQTFRMARRTQDQALLVEAHYTQGNTLLWIGEFASARTHFEQGLALYDSQQHGVYAFRYGHDPGVACLSQVGQALWLLGYPDQALRRGNEAISLAQELSHFNSLGFALDVTAMIHQLRREWQATQEQAEATIKLGTEHGFPYWVAQGTMLLGSAVAEQRQEERGLELMRQGLAAQRAIGGRILEQYWLALQIETHLRVGQFEKGLAVLAEAFAVAENGECIWEAEVYRLKGELTLAQSSVSCLGSSVENPHSAFRIPQLEAEAEAESCFLKAIDIAQKQQARSLELRAVMSLSRLWRQQGKTAEARQMLAEIYNWFTEGFDTTDLQEAKVLLEELT